MTEAGSRTDPPPTGPAPPVSVIVVSLGRPRHLGRCLLALDQLRYPSFEIVIVADDAGLAAVGETPLARHVKTVAFDRPNISAARNLGLAAAGGRIMAFIDDDATCEPTWLTFLSRGFDDPDVAAVTGSVRGRNGIGFQSWTPHAGAKGQTWDPGEDGGDDTPPPGLVPKLVGTNMAFRRNVLDRLGGFDEAMRFYLEDTDFGLRLADAGYRAAFAPLAQVHHRGAASARRDATRMPVSLFETGRSFAIFLRRHGDPGGVYEVRVTERRKLLDHMVRGNCEPRDVARLMGSFDEGFAEGLQAAFAVPPSAPPVVAFRPLPATASPPGGRLIAGRPWSRQRLLRQAAEAVREGRTTTVMILSPTALFHRVRFTDDGVWLQTGGLWGKSRRRAPLVRIRTFRQRVQEEWARVARVRGRKESTSAS